MAFNFNRLTVKAQEIAQSAIEIAQNYTNQIVEPEHLLASIVQETGNVAESIIKKTGGNFNAVKIKVNQLLETLPKVSGTALGNQQMSQNLAKLFDVAAEEAKNFKDDYVSTEHLLLALANDKGTAGQLLRDNGITYKEILSALKKCTGISKSHFTKSGRHLSIT